MIQLHDRRRAGLENGREGHFVFEASGLPFMVFVALAWLSVFHIHRAAGVDPHNPEAIGGRVFGAVKATLVLVAALATAGPHEGELAADIATFLGMFALAQTVSVPFVSGGKLTEKEKQTALQGLLFGLQQSIGGGLLLKAVVVLLAFLLPDSCGLYVVVPVIAGGTILLSGKLFLAVLMRHLQETQPAPSEPLGIRNPIRMALAYMFGCGFVLAVLEHNTVAIDPANWMGWTGFLVGAVFGRSS